MAQWCHRCHGELAAASGESTFCQHCGAPQLRVLEENVAAKIEASEATAGGEAVEGGGIAWATVVGYAAGTAGVAAALMVGVVWVPAAFPLAWLWTVCGAVVVLGLYQRRYPASRVNARMGARIGLMYGLFAVAALVAATAGIGLAARFALHKMATLDGLLSHAMQQAAEQQMQQAAQPGGLAMSAEQLRTYYSPEVRAGLGLFLLTVMAVLLTGFSALGGALGGFLRMRRR